MVGFALSASDALGATSYWYGYQGANNCVQTGQLGSESFGCDTVGPGYLPTPGGHTAGLAHTVNVAPYPLGEDIKLSPDEDYCNYVNLGDNLVFQETNNQGPATGYETPTPYGSYQESDGHGNVCQANGSVWGFELRNSVAGNKCSEITCGMQHYVSFHDRERNDRPWAEWFGEPSLVVAVQANPALLAHSDNDVGAWGYACPDIEDRTTGDVIEYCLQEWRSQFNEAKWQNERVGECNSYGGHNTDQIQTFFYPGTTYATQYPGSSNTFVFTSPGWRGFEAGITRANLQAAISAVNATCGRASSTDPKDWAIVGIEQGVEGWRHLTELGASTANVSARTVFMPLPPTTTTEPATDVSGSSAILHGAANPFGYATKFYFEYGTTTGYGSSTPEAPGEWTGSGTNVVPVSGGADYLKMGTTYHYRLVVSNANGTVYGADKVFQTAGPTITMEPATEVDEDSATLRAVVNPNLKDTHYRFEFGTTAAYGSTFSLTDIGAGRMKVAVSQPIGELTSGTTYHYRVYAEDGTTDGFSDDRTFTTASSAWRTQCAGENISGQGAFVQRIAQELWTPAFNTSTVATACSGTQGTHAKPTVSFTSSGSGVGLESWGVNGHAATFGPGNAFVATDEPPNPAQKAQIEASETKLVPEAVATVPVAQTAIAIVVNLPAGCTATSKKNKGRLELNNVTLEAIFRGTITKWSQITEDNDALSGAGCDPTTQIKPIVREDQAGTTHILKRYLSLIANTPFESDTGGTSSWTASSEGADNTHWPKLAEVTKPATAGEAGVIQQVESTPSSIGYANLADVRDSGGFTPGAGGGGPFTGRFWTPVQNDGLATTGTLTYDDPSSNKDVEAVGDSNCKLEEYTNGELAFPPESVLGTWNNVTTRTSQPNYPLCGFTYDLALTNYDAFPATNLAESTAARNYLEFVLAKNAGQKLVGKHDYLALPNGTVVDEARKGAEKIVR